MSKIIDQYSENIEEVTLKFYTMLNHALKTEDQADFIAAFGCLAPEYRDKYLGGSLAFARSHKLIQKINSVEFQQTSPQAALVTSTQTIAQLKYPSLDDTTNDSQKVINLKIELAKKSLVQFGGDKAIVKSLKPEILLKKHGFPLGVFLSGADYKALKTFYGFTAEQKDIVEIFTFAKGEQGFQIAGIQKLLILA